ncbi:unnamed protein product [Linum trigynum]|uniref:Uncharacterized protein n=1 Tax=Linum trigynum TaxID=586398 RepID=A0AAV2GRD6_9ROSI
MKRSRLPDRISIGSRIEALHRHSFSLPLSGSSGCDSHSGCGEEEEHLRIPDLLNLSLQPRIPQSLKSPAPRHHRPSSNSQAMI